MALNTSKCNHLTPQRSKGSSDSEPSHVDLAAELHLRSQISRNELVV